MVLVIAALAGMITLSILGQTTAGERADTPIRVDTVLINIPVIISDREGRYIPGLKREDFSILLNGEKQDIEYFADADVPLTVAIILDISASTRPFSKAISEGARAFIAQLKPADQGLVVTFDQRTEVVCALTADKGKIKKKLGTDYAYEHLMARDNIPGAVGSNMYDAVNQVVTRELAGVKGRKAVVVLTDGFVRGTIPLEKFHETMIVGDTLVYPVMFLTKNHMPPGVGGITFGELVQRHPANGLYRIANETGGRLLVAGRDLDFKTAFESVADELRKQYVLGFYPSRLGPSPHVSLGVNRPGASLRSKKTIRVQLPSTDP